MPAVITAEELQRKADAKRRRPQANTATSSSAPPPAEAPVCPECGVRPARTVRPVMGITMGPFRCEACAERAEQERARGQAARAHSARREKLEDFLSAAGVNVRKYGEASLETFEAKPDWQAFRAAQRFVRAFRGSKRPGLYLCSERPGEVLAPGNGKTHLAVAILRELVLDSPVRPADLRFVFVPELLIEIQDTFDNPALSMGEVVRKYSEPELLVWDDLGSEKVSEFAMRTLYTILYKREGRSDVFTSNLSLDQIEARDPYAERITSRIAGAARIVSLSGPDRRLQRQPSRGAA